MAEMDQGIKRLLQARPEDVLALALPGVEYLEPIQTDVATEPQLVLDTLFRVRYQGEECAVNVEAQAYPDPEMPRRCFEYGSRASIVHRLPVLSVVLWLQRRGRPPAALYEMRVGSWVQATWQVTNVEVYELSAEQIVASEAIGLLPLVPFMRGANVPTIERAARAITQQTAGALSADLVSLLAVFMARFQGDAAARALVRSVTMSTEILDESPLYRAWRAEWQADGLREATRIALLGRYGALDEATLALVNAAPEPALRAVLAHIATDTLEQVRERLRQPGA